MIKAVAKSRYLRGAKATGKAKAHVRYIEHRPGEDKERGAREFFSREREGIKGREVSLKLDQQDDRGVICHKLILSPGVDNPDLQAYTREMMETLGKEKGLELDWYAVEHKNTDHPHVHVVIMGTSEDGHRVRLDRDDLKFLRDQGDRYLEREHTYDRYLDREMDRLLRDPERAQELKYERGQGDREYERLFYGDKDDKRRRGEDAERDRREWEILDKELHKQFDKPDRGLERGKGYRQWNLEQSGRLSDFHERRTAQEAKERLGEQSRSEDPAIAEAAARQLADIERMESERMEQFKELDIDKLIDGKDPEQRELDRLIDREFKDLDREMKELMRSGKGQDERLQGFNVTDLFKIDKEPERGAEAERTFEADRQVRSQEESQDRDDREEEKDRDRGDDMFGGR